MRWLVRLWRSLPRQFQVLTMKVLHRNRRLYLWLLYRHVDAKDRAAGANADLPPAELRYRVSGSPDRENFVQDGKNCAADVRSVLLRVGHELGSFERILDFGCGCGRTLVYLKDFAPHARFDATDIDVKAIEWCRQHLDFARFSLSKENPPLDYAADTFEFIYAISVFTHFTEDHQFRWLNELRRIAKPAGIVLVTVDGRNGDQGIVFEPYEKGLFPPWYQNAYHSRQYVVANFGEYFNVLEYFPRSMNNHQDVVVLQKPVR